MKSAAALRSGKTHRDENFPVASRLIHPRHRALILAFYDFVRTADDIADHPSLPERDKLDRLDDLERGLLGNGGAPEADELRQSLAGRGLSPHHARDLLKAFRLDVTKRRYRDFDDLLAYCRLSAMPVGRFVLDVHGERQTTWPASDALCAALQIINHLQDCGSDYRRLDRVYVPLELLSRHGLTVEALGQAEASPALRRCLQELASATSRLLAGADQLPMLVNDFRLSLEISVIYRLARALIDRVSRRDPLSENVHLGPAGVAGRTLIAIGEALSRRLQRPSDTSRETTQNT